MVTASDTSKLSDRVIKEKEELLAALSEGFLLKCIDLIRTGIGQPAFHNSRVAIERHLLNHHVPLEAARPFAIAGCVQSCAPGYMDGYWYARFNVAKLIELVLENGRDN